MKESEDKCTTKLAWNTSDSTQQANRPETGNGNPGNGDATLNNTPEFGVLLQDVCLLAGVLLLERRQDTQGQW